MRILLILYCIIMASCQPNSKAVAEQNPLFKDRAYKKIANNDKTYYLYYKTEEESMSPVTRITYFVTKYDNSVLIKHPETVAAIKIYWKNNRTIAIVPYTDVARKQSDVVGAQEETYEILIPIKH